VCVKSLLLTWSTIRCLLSSWNPKTSLHLRSGRTNHERCVPKSIKIRPSVRENFPPHITPHRKNNSTCQARGVTKFLFYEKCPKKPEPPTSKALCSKAKTKYQEERRDSGKVTLSTFVDQSVCQTAAQISKILFLLGNTKVPFREDNIFQIYSAE
jgi:hypothetical protein